MLRGSQGKQLSKYRTRFEKWSSRRYYKQRGRILFLEGPAFLLRCSRCRSSLQFQCPLKSLSGEKEAVDIYLRVRRKALEENSSRGVSASVPYFARRRSDSAKGLRGFTSITEIHRETYNGALFDTEEIDEGNPFWESVSFFSGSAM